MITNNEEDKKTTTRQTRIEKGRHQKKDTNYELQGESPGDYKLK